MMLVRILYATLLAMLVALTTVRSAPSDRSLKKDNPQWEDLGWAWGKRSAPVYMEDPDALMQRYVRSLKAIKKNPDWHDLGWAWGRK